MKFSATQGICSQCTSDEYLVDFLHFNDLITRWNVNWEKYSILYHHILRKYLKKGILVEDDCCNNGFICEKCISKLLNDCIKE